MVETKVIVVSATAALSGLSWSASRLGSMLATADASTGTIITDQTLVPIGIAVACTVAIMVGVWRASAAFQQVCDRLTALETKVADLQKAASK